MKIKNLIAQLLRKNNNGWQYFSTSSMFEDNKPEEYYFGIIYSAIDAIAKGVQGVNYGLYRKSKDGYQEVYDHPAIRLLKRPNAIHSDRDFLYIISSQIDLYGQAFLWTIRTALKSKNIVELRLINAGEVQTIPDMENLISGYEWRHGLEIRKLNTNELVNILRPDPLNPIYGLSTIQKAKYEGDNELNSQKLNASFYANGGLPSGVISTDSAVDPQSFEVIKRRIRQQYEGIKNAYKIMFLTHGANYKAIQPTQRDMEYVSQRKLNRDQILSIFQVPGSVIGISENSNRATSEVEYRSFMKNTVEPRLKFIFDKLNRFYLPLFDGTENMEFRFESVVPTDKEHELNEKTQSVRKWRTPNEIRAMEGLGPIEGGDTLDSAINYGFSLADTSNDEDINTPDDKEKAENKALETHCQACKPTYSCNNPEHKQKIEELPKPSDQKGEKLQEYTRRRNAYIQAKENRYALELSQHVNFLIKDIERKAVKKLKDLDQDLELTPMAVEGEIMPEKEKWEQWKVLLYLIVLKNNTQIWKTVTNQLKDVYGFNPVEVDDDISSFISHRANFTAKTISDTTLKKIRGSIDKAVKNGEIDLKKIKKAVIKDLKDAKDWKVEQIARTELAWSYSEAQMKTYQTNGVEKVKWICGLGACEICKSNCGEIVELNKAFPSGHTNEPAHINCRCMVVAV